MLMLSSILLAQPIKASAAGYSMTEAYTVNAVTVDGKWTSSTEWSDAWINLNVGGTNAIFGYKMDTNSGTYLMSFLLESPYNTTNAADTWTICIDGGAAGGTAPQANDVKIVITGHTTLAVYVGSGTAWVAASTAQKNAVTWKDSLSTSSYIPYSHWILEVQADKGSLGDWGASAPPDGVYVAMYSADHAAQGSIAWPPTPPASTDNPNSWGLIADYAASIPESISIGPILILSSAAMLLGFYLLRKRQATKLTPL
jgi:hypothetical protein